MYYSLVDESSHKMDEGHPTSRPKKIAFPKYPEQKGPREACSE